MMASLNSRMLGKGNGGGSSGISSTGSGSRGLSVTASAVSNGPTRAIGVGSGMGAGTGTAGSLGVTTRPPPAVIHVASRTEVFTDHGSFGKHVSVLLGVRDALKDELTLVRHYTGHA